MYAVAVPHVAAYLLMAALIILVLVKGFIAPVLFGMLIFVITRKLIATAEKKVSTGLAKALAVTIVTLTLTGILYAGGFGAFRFGGAAELQALMLKLATTVEELKNLLPAWMTSSLPDDIHELQSLGATYLKSHADMLSKAGVTGVKVVVEMIICAVIGIMVSLTKFELDRAGPFASSLFSRISVMGDTFRKIVTAQAKISAVNAVLTAIYLLAILPLFGVHLAYGKTLVFLTFILGMLPVVGNLVSNTIIVLASLNHSVMAAGGSLAFLIGIHKLEYFLNARIVGEEVDASAWELLIAMLVAEALFGLPGVVAAPILYAYLKYELQDLGWL